MTKSQAKKLKAEDLKAITFFGKIIMNHLKMKKVMAQSEEKETKSKSKII